MLEPLDLFSFRQYGISTTDDIAKANVPYSLHQAVTAGINPEYSQKDTRKDMEFWIAFRKSENLSNVWVDIPLNEPTNLEKHLHSEYIKNYGGGPITGTTGLLQTFFSRSRCSHWVIIGNSI